MTHIVEYNCIWNNNANKFLENFMDEISEFGEVLGTFKLSNTELDQIGYTYRKDYLDRIIYINFDLSVDTITDYSRLILEYNRQDKGIPVEERKPIKIYIFSYGGDVDAALHFVDICKLSKTPVYTYNMGVAMSGGFYILLAGEKRFALKNSTALFHQGSAQTSGDAEKIKSFTKQYSKILKLMFDYTVERTKISKEILSKKKTTEWYMLAEEQLQLGVVDKIVEDVDEVL